MVCNPETFCKRLKMKLERLRNHVEAMVSAKELAASISASNGQDHANAKGSYRGRDFLFVRGNLPFARP